MLESKNFFVSLVTLLSMLFAYFNIELPNSPEVIVDSAEGLGFGAIFLTVLLPNFLNPITKLIQNWRLNGFNWDFIKSKNFWTQAITTLLLLVQIFQPLTTFWIVLIMQGANFLYHLLFEKDKVPVPLMNR